MTILALESTAGDVAEVESSTEPEKKVDSSGAPQSGLWLMVVVIAGLGAVAVFANIQKIRRNQIERVTIIPAATATPARSR